MDNKSKTFGLLLILIIVFSCLELLMVKPANAQNNASPSVSILYPTNSTFFNVSIGGVFFQLLYQTNDTLSWAGYSIDEGANVTCTGNTTDNSAYLNDGYQLPNSGYNTLTLYANDTAGNWATPQNVTFRVAYYSDATYPPTTPSPFPTVTVATISGTVVLILAVAVASLLLYRRRRKSKAGDTKT